MSGMINAADVENVKSMTSEIISSVWLSWCIPEMQVQKGAWNTLAYGRKREKLRILKLTKYENTQLKAEEKRDGNW